MPISHIADDPTLITAVFENIAVYDPIKSKEAGRPMVKDVPHVRITMAANRQSQPVFPANSIWKTVRKKTDWGEELEEVTYAMRFPKQYAEFVAGGPQSFNGTLLTEIPSLTSADRLNLKGLNVHTAEALEALDGPALKMLGPNGREMKNAATAYLEKARAAVGSGQLADALSIRDGEIERLKQQIAALTPAQTDTSRETIPLSVSTVSTFDTFTDEDIQAWLTDAKVTVDGRWSRNTLIAKAEEVLAKEGKLKHAQAA